MRVLVAGDWHSELHEEVVAQALLDLGHEVKSFKWHRYISRGSTPISKLLHLWRRVQNKYLFGPLISRINDDFVAAAKCFRPDMVFVYRGTHIDARALACVRAAAPGCVLVGYNNDDPFGPKQPRYLWRRFLAALPEYNLVLAYRHANLAEYKAAGARRVELLRSWFVPERNHFVELSESEKARFECDVVFVGHYEPDQRLEYLEEIVRQGFRLRLFGPGYDWDPVIKKSQVLGSLAPVQLVWGEDYNRALCGAKLALCFLSKLNRDTYTRRCFEIPATRTLMLSEYSDDLAGLFVEGSEADFFRNRDEMMRKIRGYISQPARRQSVAEAGHQRIARDRHDVQARMTQVIAWTNDIQLGGGR